MWPWKLPLLVVPAPAQVDFLSLSKKSVRKIKDSAKGSCLLNKRQCQDLSTKLSGTVKNIELLVLCSGAPSDLFQRALENLYSYLEKAKLLVDKCGKEDWCAAAVFQIQNENAFREILLGVSLCYNAIYEQAKTCRLEEWKDHPEDLRKSSMFLPASASDVRRDRRKLQSLLKNFVDEPSSIIQLDEFAAPKKSMQQCLARYLLVKLNFHGKQSQTKDPILQGCSAILWRKESEGPEVWTDPIFLGSGAGASGVCSIKWLGIPCAKKEFHDPDFEPIFLREAGILAGLKHPRIVDFICCGNGQEKGDRFIAMELLEKSLDDQIRDQKGKQFALPVAVDMMAQMAQGMLYLHDRGVAHRDLKPQNVVVNKLSFPHLKGYFCVKLVDFGFSKTEVEISKSYSVSFPGVGTTRYRAPEVHPKAKGKVDWCRADVYSFAITCAHVLTLKTPFDQIKRLGDIYDELLDGTRPELRSDCPQELVSLLTDCWNTKPRSRPSSREVCTRLEEFRHKILRGFSTADQGFHEEKVDGNTGFDFIKKKMVEQSAINKDEYVEHHYSEVKVHETCRVGLLPEIEEVEQVFDINKNDVVSKITCTNNHALELLQQSPYKFGCNVCRTSGTGAVYHCETCGFDAHPDCAEIKKEVTIIFRNAPLYLRIRKSSRDVRDAKCCFCQESVMQDGEWLYKSVQGMLYAHPLCAKYPSEMTHHEHSYAHPLTLVESPPGKTCKCCSKAIKGYYYTCATGWCIFELHPLCAILPAHPRLGMKDTSPKLSLVTHRTWRGDFIRCGKCDAACNYSWFYNCKQSNMAICMRCSHMAVCTRSSDMHSAVNCKQVHHQVYGNKYQN